MEREHEVSQVGAFEAGLLDHLRSNCKPLLDEIRDNDQKVKGEIEDKIKAAIEDFAGTSAA